MTTSFQKPSLAAVRALTAAQIAEVQKSVTDSIQTIVVSNDNALNALETAKMAQLAAAAASTTEAITISQQTVDGLKAAEEAAMQAAKAASDARKAAEDAHNQKAKTLKQSFNQAAKDIKAQAKAEAKAAKAARNAALAAEQAKVSAAKAAGRSAQWAEAKATVAYDIFVVKDTTVRVGHGVSAVAGALTTAFKTGYNSESGVSPPAILVKQETPATEAPKA